MTGDAMRYSGLLTPKSAYRDYTDTVGLRNSHDKAFLNGISFASRVFVRDNLAFLGDTVSAAMPDPIQLAPSPSLQNR